MPSNKGVQIILLVEDSALERLARRILEKLGVEKRKIRVGGYPIGQGSAKQWVTGEYVERVDLYRSQRNHLSVGLLVRTEADELTVKEREEQLASALLHHDRTKRRHDERIAHWIPKWNVETWILHLNGEPADENTKQKPDLETNHYRTAAEKFVEKYRQSRREHIDTLDSLKHAYEETSRLF